MISASGGGGCAAGKQLNQHPHRAQPSFLPPCPPGAQPAAGSRCHPLQDAPQTPPDNKPSAPSSSRRFLQPLRWQEEAGDAARSATRRVNPPHGFAPPLHTAANPGATGKEIPLGKRVVPGSTLIGSQVWVEGTLKLIQFHPPATGTHSPLHSSFGKARNPAVFWLHLGQHGHGRCPCSMCWGLLAALRPR